MKEKDEVLYTQEYALLMMRNLIASKEFNTASGNSELARHGEWRCDRYGIDAQIQEEMEELKRKMKWE